MNKPAVKRPITAQNHDPSQRLGIAVLTNGRGLSAALDAEAQCDGLHVFSRLFTRFVSHRPAGTFCFHQSAAWRPGAGGAEWCSLKVMLNKSNTVLQSANRKQLHPDDIITHVQSRYISYQEAERRHTARLPCRFSVHNHSDTLTYTHLLNDITNLSNMRLF